MKYLLSFLLFACSVEDQINLIRPGSLYRIHSGNYAGIEWLDNAQVKPTAQELDAALESCQQSIASSRPLSEDQRLTDLENAVSAIATATKVPVSLPLSQ